MKPQALLRDVTARLAAAGIESARTDAVWLICHACGLQPAQLYAADDLPCDLVRPLVERRIGREPLQHILGTAAFRHVVVQVGPGVFVPRPETELLVDAVLPCLRALAAPIAVDLCAGSGALALAMADEVPAVKVHAVERDPRALVWLRRNAAGTAVGVQPGDVSDPALLIDLRGRVDVVVSNPPYVPSGTVLAPEVRHDPASAVFAGPDGLAVLPAVIARAGELLRPGGLLAVEHDDTHAAIVPALLRADGRWADVVDHEDLTGRPRYATARRASG